MFTAPIIQTPYGERAAEIDFAQPNDAGRLRSWGVPQVDPTPHTARDAMELGKLAVKRWRYYLHREEAALSVDELRRKAAAAPQAEIGFLLVAKPTWRPSPRLLGIAWCRRTWCNHVVLDFLAAHPATLGPARGYSGLGTALLYSLAAVAGEIDCRLVWGECTASSATFYQRVLGRRNVADHFFIRHEMLAQMRRKLSLISPSSAHSTR